MTSASTQARGHFSGKSRFNFRQFTDADSPLEPQSLSAAVVYQNLIGDHEVVDRRPVGVAATRAALRNTRGEPDSAIRLVTLDWASTPSAAKNDRDLEVVGPKDGRPIIIQVHSGIPDLVAASGHIVFVAGSSAGNRIEVRDGATATIFAEAGRKISVTADPGSTVNFYAAAGARGYQSIADGATFTAHGDLERVTLSTDKPWLDVETKAAEAEVKRVADENAVYAWMEARKAKVTD